MSGYRLRSSYHQVSVASLLTSHLGQEVSQFKLQQRKSAIAQPTTQSMSQLKRWASYQSDFTLLLSELARGTSQSKLPWL